MRKRAQPQDPTTKRTEATIKIISTGQVMKCSKGMAATLLTVTKADDITRKTVEDAVAAFASHGLRALGVAICNVVEGQDDGWQFVAVMPIYDPPRSDTAETLAKAMELGVSVKMLTGGAKALSCDLSASVFILSTFSLHAHTCMRDRHADHVTAPLQTLGLLMMSGCYTTLTLW